ncbi:cofilin family protein [Streptomyces subrutilus]|uniref:ADF-H domain-containing protein n=1 Tax=Streptomyces subrutilus TaxID=36818 RepID=A0A1E5Q0B2_9ACTN|nr:cofilin family protein [Streptomyces subrutilus]OEJ35062.1 hypothetical protein BGK67_30425 [Streptomyces subrutilus]
MSSPTNLSQEGVDALRHLRGRREVNTVILRHRDTPQALAVELEGNLTHDELLQALPSDEARLVVHELSFATREGMRRHETLLILWVPVGAAGREEESYTVGYTALKELLGDVHVHLTARRPDQLDYRRLVALAG